MTERKKLELPFPVPMMHHAPGSQPEDLIYLTSKYPGGFQGGGCNLELKIT
jgi:hypothetical protein